MQYFASRWILKCEIYIKIHLSLVFDAGGSGLEISSERQKESVSNTYLLMRLVKMQVKSFGVSCLRCKAVVRPYQSIGMISDIRDICHVRYQMTSETCNCGGVSALGFYDSTRGL